MMDRQLFLAQGRFAAIAVSACVSAHLLVYRALFGVRFIDPHEVPSDDLLPLAASALSTLVVVALAGRSVGSRRAAVGAAIVAGAAAEAYFVGSDWIRAGWGGLVAHDVWFGDREYWIMMAIQAAVIIVGFTAAVATTWGICRHARTSSEAG